MPVGIRVQIRSAEVDRDLGRFFDHIITDRTELNVSIGGRAEKLTESHLVAIAQTRHATAQRLGASPSGHWGQAAEKTSFEADAEGATITINQPGISRAAHDVKIEPGPGKKYLALPAIAAAYNQRAYRLPDLHPIVRSIEGEKRAIGLGKKDAAGTETVWYWLVKSVTQTQDRTLLPSDEEYRLAALAGIGDYIDRLLAS